MSDATIWGITLELSITILEASCAIIYYVYTTVLNYDGLQLIIVLVTGDYIIKLFMFIMP